ncbi:MAG: glycosyltransferase family 4 protein [Xanthomonadales bacterium]|nr:glycosyltransferase family 4 protein [Xanthomonadales bacterium]
MGDPAASLAWVLIVTGLVSGLSVVAVLRLARDTGMLDRPGGRASHAVPTPTGAGIGIVFSLIVGSLLASHLLDPDWVWWWMLLPGAAVLSLVGWWDDRRSLPAGWRLLIQFLAGCLLLWGLKFSGGQLAWPWLGAWLIAVVALMNIHNFMDGSNGLAGAQAVFSGAALAVWFHVEGASAAMLASLLVLVSYLGFLPFNTPSARIFMGDAGSVPLGFLVAALLSVGLAHAWLPVPVAALVVAVFVIDAGLTLFKRAIRGERWYTAHKQHIYQRLIAQGWSHSRVLLCYQAINLALVAPALVLARMYPELAWEIAGVMYLLLMTGWYRASRWLEVRT